MGQEEQGKATEGPEEQGDDGDRETKSFLEWIRGSSPQWLANCAARRSALEEEIAERWGNAFDHFDVLVIAAQRALVGSDQAFLPAAVARRDVVYEALHALAIRACQTAKEVRVLMGAGYGAGAATRWRALHEVHVAARLIEMHRAPLATRYLLHNIVEKNKLANATEKVYEGMGQPVPAPIAEAIADVRREYAKLKETYASEPRFFKGDYGWATGYAKETTIVGLEEAAGLADRRFAYRIASDTVHSNVAGAFAGSVTTPEGEMLVLGPSSEDVAESGMSAALALVETIRIFLRHVLQSSDGDSHIRRELALTLLAYEPLLQDAIGAFQTSQ